MKLSKRLLKNMTSMIDYYSGFNPSPLSIKQFIDFGRSASQEKSFIFLRKELPVRLANIMKEINLLPDKLLKTPSVRLVNDWYLRSFEEIMQYEKSEVNSAVLERFCQELIKIKNRHTDVVQTMAQGVLELKEFHPVDQSMENSIQYFLDRFYMSRISIRMLINQHTLLFGGQLDGQMNSRHIGCIDSQCDPVSVVRDAYEHARMLCNQYYFSSPELIIQKHNALDYTSPIKIIYVPSHLFHMLFELFKNSMRAVMEFHGKTDNYPPIVVVIVLGKEDVCVKVSDRGGGIPRSATDQLFHYMYSTAPKPSISNAFTVPLAGYGYGLPISRLYARYFHGDLMLLSCEGFGTDTVIYMKALSNEANELLPIFNKTSTKFYRSTIPTGDWSNSSNIRHLTMNRLQS